jgi:hypothetical protein
LAGHIDLLANRLSTEGYSRIHSRIQLRYIGHFNRWLDRKGLTAKQIDEEMIERFWHSFMRRKKVRRGDMSALFTLLDFLREQGVTPQRTIKAVLTPGSRMLRTTGATCARNAAFPMIQSATCCPSSISFY